MTDPDPIIKTQATPEQVKKARMLVSMLGADFARSSKNPFFKDLARTAVQPLPAHQQPPDMSVALARLVKTLADPKVARRLKPAPASAPLTRAAEPEKGTLDPDLVRQHPVLIAKQLVTLPKPERLAILRRLRGQSARQVTAYLAELESSRAG